MKVLIVDDSGTTRVRLSQMLKQSGIGAEIVEARDGQEAIYKYKIEKPDIVTMDLTMPKMNGIEAIQKLVEINPDVKIVVISAVSQKKLVMEALKSGAKHYLTKPFDDKKLMSLLVMLQD